MSQQVGIIGLGTMGGAFARNLIAAGHQVHGHDPDAAKSEALSAAGGHPLLSPAAVAAKADVLITSLPSPAALAAVADDIADTDGRATVALECSTLAIDDKVAAAQQFATAGITLLDTPISGTGSQAVAKKIVVFASGDAATYDRVSDVIAGFAETQHYVGAFGDGSRLKFVANTLIALHILAAAEATHLAAQAGLDLDRVHAILSTSPATSVMYDLRGRLMKDQAFEPPLMALDLWQKDMDLIATFADSVAADLPSFNASRPVFAAAGKAFPKADTAAVIRALRGET